MDHCNRYPKAIEHFSRLVSRMMRLLRAFLITLPRKTHSFEQHRLVKLSKNHRRPRLFHHLEILNWIEILLKKKNVTEMFDNINYDFIEYVIN